MNSRSVRVSMGFILCGVLPPAGEMAGSAVPKSSSFGEAQNPSNAEVEPGAVQ